MKRTTGYNWYIHDVPVIRNQSVAKGKDGNEESNYPVYTPIFFSDSSGENDVNTIKSM